MNTKKRKNPPTPTNSPTPAKKTPQKRGRKRDRPNIFMTRDHFKSTPTNEVVLKSPDEVKTIQDFRMFFSEEKTRGVSFMFNPIPTGLWNDVTNWGGAIMARMDFRLSKMTKRPVSAQNLLSNEYFDP